MSDTEKWNNHLFPFHGDHSDEEERKGRTHCTCVKQTRTAGNKRLNSRLLYLLSVEVNKVLSLQFCWFCGIRGMKGKKWLNLSHPPHARDAMSKPTWQVPLLPSCPPNFGHFHGCYIETRLLGAVITFTHLLLELFAHPLQGLLLGWYSFAVVIPLSLLFRC